MRKEEKKKKREQCSFNKALNLNSTVIIDDLSKELDFNQENTDTTDDEAFQDSKENIEDIKEEAFQLRKNKNKFS